jgi:hypothetical protein
MRRWAPFYVAEAGRQAAALPRTPLVDSLGQPVEQSEPLPGFVDFVNEPLISPETAGAKPRYVVAVPRTIGEPRRKGDGTYIATWDVQVAIWMWGGNYQDTQDRLGFYVIAVRQLMLQHPSLGGFAQTTTWRGEQYTEIASTSFRTWGQAAVQFAVEVDGVVNAFAGPAEPPADPTAPPAAPTPWVSTELTVQPLR